MSRKQFILFLGIGLMLSKGSNAQNQLALQSGSTDSKLRPSQSGNANLGSAFSPDLFNGTANISIPIYSNGDNGVSLTYNTAGIPVDEPAGFIGQHWNLQAGGSISRIMRDVPDEMNVAQNQMASLDGTGDPGAANGIKGKFSQYGLGDVSQLDAQSYVDDESDDFMFSVGGFSFTFNIGSNGFIFTNPHKNVQIDLLLNGQVVSTTGTKIPSSGFYAGLQEISFRVRDAQGNWYYFQKGDVSHIDYGPKGAPTLSYNYISKWVLSSIVANDGKTTSFVYSSQAPTYYKLYEAFTSAEPSQTSVGGISTVEDAAVYSTQNLYSFLRPESISYPNLEKVTFIYNQPPNGRCDMASSEPIMTEIQVSSSTAKTRYIFDQAYSVSLNQNYVGATPPATVPETPLGSCITVVQNGTENYRYHRLILKGIHIANADNTSTQPYYTFGYNRSSTFRLPAKWNNGQDYFGYYNGRSQVVQGFGDMINIPNHQNMYSTGAFPYAADRTDDWNYAQADLLNLMVNAYGGQTKFYYGPHVLTNQLSNAGITSPSDSYFMGVNANDGVRLDSVIMLDPHYPGLWTVERFAYTGGQRFMPGGYFHFPIDISNPTQPGVLFNGTYVTPHQFINGSNHGYSAVIDTTLNQSNQILGIKSTLFRNISEAPNTTAYYKTGTKQYFQVPYTNKQYIKDWQIGLPTVMTEYDNLKNITSRTINSYTDNLDATSAVGKVENLHRLSTTAPNGAVTTVDSDFYHPFTGTSLLTQTITQKFVDGTTSINDTVTYTYDDHNNLSAIIAQSSLGEHFILNSIYNYNVDGPLISNNHPGTTIYNMTNAGLEIKIGMERWKQGATIYDNTLYDASITKYNYSNGLLSAQKLYSLQALNPISFTAYTGISMGGTLTSQYNNILTAYNTTQAITNFQVASEVLQFDAKNNPVETQLKGQNSYVSMMWDATNYNKLVDVQNARLSDIGYTSFEHSPNVTYGGVAIVDGGFSFNDQGHLENAAPVTGTGSFKLTPLAPTNYITSPALTAGKSYVMTFWAKPLPPTTVTPTVTFISGGTSITMPTNVGYTGPNGWVNYIVTYTPTQAGNLQITATSTAYIDELRFFPAGAMMKSWVYAPLLGATSSTDPSGRVTYYEYDTFGRPVDTKDQEGNVTSKKEYRTAQ